GGYNANGVAMSYDQAEVSYSVRSADWIKTEYNNQSSPSTFYAYGAIGVQNRAAGTAGVAVVNRGTGIAWDNSSWSYRKPITIDHTKVSGVASSTLSSFPVLVSVTDTQLKSTSNGGLVASSTGADILFTKSDGTTLLDYEIESYASTTGQLIAWINIPILSAVTDTTIYEYFGNASAPAETPGNITGTWDTNYKGVWHLSDAATSTSTESTTNANNGANNSLTSASGQISNSGSFNGSSSYINVPDAASLNPTSAVTMSAWVKTSTAGKYIIAKDPSDSSYPSNKSNMSYSDSSFGPAITNAYTDPNDVAPGGKMLISADVSDPCGITSVTAEMPYEGGSDILQMNITKGTIYQGTWQGTWIAHDTLDKGYTTTVTAKNAKGVQSQSEIDWTDSSCTVGGGNVSLNPSTYSATVNTTLSVTVTSTGISGSCSQVIQDNTGGSYATVPNTDTDLDCNGISCSTIGGTPFSKTLRCGATPGTYSIRGGLGGVFSSPGTVNCTASGNSAVPYALSTASGGQFLILNSSTNYTATSSVAVTDGNWHYMSATYDSTTMK